MTVVRSQSRTEVLTTLVPLQRKAHFSVPDSPKLSCYSYQP